MTIRLLGGWQQAVLFELIHIPKRAPELDIAVRRSQLREKFNQLLGEHLNFVDLLVDPLLIGAKIDIGRRPTNQIRPLPIEFGALNPRVLNGSF